MFIGILLWFVGVEARVAGAEQLFHGKQRHFGFSVDALGNLSKKDLAAYWESREAARQTRARLIYQRAATHHATVAHPSNELQTLDEMAAAIQNSSRPPIHEHYDFFTVPFDFIARLNYGVGRNALPAPEPNAEPPDGESTFWNNRHPSPDADLFYSFDRTGPSWSSASIAEYDHPKLNYGVNPGFEASLDGLKIRVKFGEIRSEPFASRVFWSLGYNTDITDFCEGLKVRYNRRFFREFNLHKPIKTEFRLLILPLYRLNLQKWHDPFAYIAWAVKKNGERISGEALKQMLLVDPGLKPEDHPENFKTEVEEQIDYLVTVPANVQLRARQTHSLGPWSFNQLDHPGRRELRGAGLLAAWIGWYDCRLQNTRLKIIEGSNANARLVHCFSDLGGGLGNARGIFSGQEELPNEFGWTFTDPPKFQGPGRMTIPFRVTGYRPMEKNTAFETMTFEDALWMARLIGSLTERQLIEALIASGYDSAEVRLYSEKLISRRDQMMIDLALQAEIPLLREHSIRRFDYSPRREGPVEVKLSSGETVRAPIGERVIRNGRLINEMPLRRTLNRP